MPKHDGISIRNLHNSHRWTYYEADELWHDEGIDLVTNFTNTTAGIIKGSNLAGKVFAESDGTGSVVPPSLTCLLNSLVFYEYSFIK